MFPVGGQILEIREEFFYFLNMYIYIGLCGRCISQKLSWCVLTDLEEFYLIDFYQEATAKYFIIACSGE